MRLRSIDLANASADIKLGATNTTSLRQALARRGDELYERVVKVQVEPDQAGKMVAIDIDTAVQNIPDSVRKFRASGPALHQR